MQFFVRKSLFTAALFASTLLYISSCKKDDDSGPNAAATNIAADGSGFKDVFSADYLSDFNGSFRVPDFTVEDGKLHIVYATTLVSQQGTRYKLFRRSGDIATGAIIPQPAGADTVLEGFNLPSSEHRRGPALFLPYRNIFTCNKFRSNGQLLESAFSGDLAVSYNVYHSFIPSLGFRYPVHNPGGTLEGAICTGPAPTPPSYLFKAYQSVEVGYVNPSSYTLHAMILESYRHSFQDSVFGIAFQTASLPTP